MLEFLSKINIAKETIDYMTENLSENEISALSDNDEECLKIISLLKRLGIQNIDDLLMYETQVFFKTANRVYYELAKYDFNELVNDINNDYTAIEKYV